MKIEPLNANAPKDYALLTPGHLSLYVETKWGKQLFKGKRDVENALSKLKGHTCYVASSLQRLRNCTSATQWVLSTWRGRDVRMTHIPTGVRVTSLQSTLLDAPDQFQALSTALEWVHGYGVAPGSISSMAWKLLRASLSSTVQVGFDPEISERAFFGGRQEIWQPDTYGHAKSVDIKAAYPTAMAARPIALTLREVDSSTVLDPDVAGLAEADIYVPIQLPYAPLPVRVAKTAIQFQYHEIHGIYTWRELDAARRLGCDVKVEKVWSPRREFDLFSTWWDMAQTGRELPDGADQLAKAIANATWGQFSMRGDERGETYWVDDRGSHHYSLDLEARRLPHVYGLHIAAEICARVRTQTLLEGLYGAKAWVLHCDTDGIIVHESGQLPANSGEGFGQWRVKETMNQIEIRAPQFYRYTKPDEPNRWYYVASGQTHDQAVATFARHPDTLTKISFLSGYDQCLPSGSSRDADELGHYLDELAKVAV